MKEFFRQFDADDWKEHRLVWAEAPEGAHPLEGEALLGEKADAVPEMEDIVEDEEREEVRAGAEERVEKIASGEEMADLDPEGRKELSTAVADGMMEAAAEMEPLTRKAERQARRARRKERRRAGKEVAAVIVDLPPEPAKPEHLEGPADTTLDALLGEGHSLHVDRCGDRYFATDNRRGVYELTDGGQMHKMDVTVGALTQAMMTIDDDASHAFGKGPVGAVGSINPETGWTPYPGGETETFDRLGLSAIEATRPMPEGAEYRVADGSGEITYYRQGESKLQDYHADSGEWEDTIYDDFDSLDNELAFTTGMQDYERDEVEKPEPELGPTKVEGSPGGAPGRVDAPVDRVELEETVEAPLVEMVTAEVGPNGPTISAALQSQITGNNELKTQIATQYGLDGYDPASDSNGMQLLQHLFPWSGGKATGTPLVTISGVDDPYAVHKPQNGDQIRINPESGEVTVYRPGVSPEPETPVKETPGKEEVVNVDETLAPPERVFNRSLSYSRETSDFFNAIGLHEGHPFVRTEDGQGVIFDAAALTPLGAIVSVHESGASWRTIDPSEGDISMLAESNFEMENERTAVLTGTLSNGQIARYRLEFPDDVFDRSTGSVADTPPVDGELEDKEHPEGDYKSPESAYDDINQLQEVNSAESLIGYLRNIFPEAELRNVSLEHSPGEGKKDKCTVKLTCIMRGRNILDDATFSAEDLNPKQAQMKALRAARDAVQTAYEGEEAICQTHLEQAIMANSNLFPKPLLVSLKTKLTNLKHVHAVGLTPKEEVQEDGTYITTVDLSFTHMGTRYSFEGSAGSTAHKRPKAARLALQNLLSGDSEFSGFVANNRPRTMDYTELEATSGKYDDLVAYKQAELRASGELPLTDDEVLALFDEGGAEAIQEYNMKQLERNMNNWDGTISFEYIIVDELDDNNVVRHKCEFGGNKIKIGGLQYQVSYKGAPVSGFYVANQPRTEFPAGGSTRTIGEAAHGMRGVEAEEGSASYWTHYKEMSISPGGSREGRGGGGGYSKTPFTDQIGMTPEGVMRWVGKALDHDTVDMAASYAFSQRIINANGDYERTERNLQIEPGTA